MNGTTRTYWRRIAASFAVYAAAGWAFVEALSTVIDRFGLPPFLQPLVVALYVAGLPVTIYLVWRTAGVERRLSWPSFAGAMGFLVLATAALFWLTRPEPVPVPTTVAILPCTVADPGDNANRAEGFAEDVHARLSRVESVKVISWNSSLFVRERGFDTPQIGEVLHVDRLVQCRMSGSGQRLEVFAELIDPGENRVLWNRDYDFVVGDIGTVVTEVVRTLLDVLTTPAQAGELKRINDIGTFSPEAYDLYLQARGSDDPATIEELTARALAIDSNYAEALMLRARNQADQLIWEDRDYIENLRAALDILQAQAERVLAIDPDMPDARSLLAGLCANRREYLGGDCSPEEQRRLAWEACRLRGDTAEGWACRHRLLSGDGQDNTEALEHWLELEPTSAEANLQYMAALFIQNRADDFVAVFDTLRMLYPDDRRLFGLLSNQLRSRGRLDEVIAWRFGLQGDRMPENPIANWRLVTDYMNLGLYEQAEKHAMIVHESRRIYMPNWVALLWWMRGDRETAAELIDWAVAEVGRGGITPGVLWIGGGYFNVLGDFDKARELYDRIFAARELESLCGAEENCLFENALYLHRIAMYESDSDEAARWLQVAEDSFDRMLPYQSGEWTTKRTRAFEGMLRIAQGRYDEAIGALREAVFLFETPAWNDEDLAVPIYRLETSPVFDPLREHPGFQALLNDYNAYLAPMRERVLQATETGDWEALRQNTLRWLRRRGE